MGYRKMNANQMKHLLVSLVAVLLVGSSATACFSIVAGKNAADDARVMIAHNEDDGAPQIVNHIKVPRKRFRPNSKVLLRNGGKLDQVPQTFSYIWSEMPGMDFSDSYVNEFAVSVTSNNCPSREDKPEITEGGIGYMLRRLIAERAKTAREGVLLAGKLVERFGYVDSGRTYVICDPSEGWLFCVANGKHWIARRVPDDHIAMVANTYTICQPDLVDKRNYLACDDIVEYAISRRWHDPNENKPFNFAASYANPDTAVHPNNLGRWWAGLKYVTDDNIKPNRDLPFSVIPKEKVTPLDIMAILRHDNTTDTAEASSATPDRFAQGRPLCSVSTQTSFVAQLRHDSPPDIGTVYWVALSRPRTSVYIPFHFAIDSFPTGWAFRSRRPSQQLFDQRVTTAFRNDPTAAFWSFANFRDKADQGDPQIAAKMQARASDIEADALAMLPSLKEATLDIYSKDRSAAARLLANFSKGIYLSSLQTMAEILSSQ